MSSTKKLNKNLRIIENVIFVLAFGFIMYHLITSYGLYIYDSIKGKGYIGAIIDPIFTHEYYISVVSILIILSATCVLWEILSFIVQLLKQERGSAQSYDKYKVIFKKVSVNYKPSFLALLIHQLLPKLILINMFWIWLPHIQKFALFTVNLKWYSWIYAYLIWEFSTWVFHFSSHRVRFLWCLHSPHHAPSELNMTVNWVHFFAESYYSTLIHLVISTLLGVNPLMFLAIMSIDSAWGVFTHVSERALKNGQLGILRYLIITPAHHRVHHAKNPLYLDTNFAFVLPIWDWMFGTLQPIKEEVKVIYGISRELEVTNFSDLYFGEILLLYRDVKNADRLKNKLLFIVMPPGWSPTCSAKTASAVRQDFLKTNPALGVTSKDRFLTAIKSSFKIDKLKVKGV
jgi:sterol desaturase/sphingolipid hydroxylase (fatty acid hydroxylase superfamily)